jgi:murein DD-endopeptidase MepM/ murein hydrolase activator NlpD
MCKDWSSSRPYQMNRALVVLALGLSASPAAARSQNGTPSAPPELVTPTLLVARIASAFDIQIVPTDLVDRMVRWQFGMRALAQGIADRLVMLGTALDRAGIRIPDLTVLTTEPLSTSPTTGESSGFGWRDDPIRHRAKYHSGADIRAKHGTPVMAAGNGLVVFCGRQGGYGNVIYVDHGGGVVTRYAHLQKIETKKDAAIFAGQRIGQVGATGRATGPHLHFEVRLDGRAVDPTTAMTIAQLERDAPAAGRLAAFALAPELQANEQSDVDPPKRRTKKSEPRPERPGRTKRVRPVS